MGSTLKFEKLINMEYHFKKSKITVLISIFELWKTRLIAVKKLQWKNF